MKRGAKHQDRQLSGCMCRLQLRMTSHPKTHIQNAFFYCPVFIRHFLHWVSFRKAISERIPTLYYWKQKAHTLICFNMTNMSFLHSTSKNIIHLFGTVLVYTGIKRDSTRKEAWRKPDGVVQAVGRERQHEKENSREGKGSENWR